MGEISDVEQQGCYPWLLGGGANKFWGAARAPSTGDVLMCPYDSTAAGIFDPARMTLSHVELASAARNLNTFYTSSCWRPH